MPDRFTNLKFSKSEVDLLREIKQVEDVAGVAHSLLTAVPFIELFASPAPTEMLVTIEQNEWDALPAAAAAIGKIKACRLQSDIQAFQLRYSGNLRAHPNVAFFSAMMDEYSRQCSA